MCFRHKWKIEASEYNPPQPLVGRLFPDQVERRVWGFTNVIEVCEKCGKRQVDEVLGKLPPIADVGPRPLFEAKETR
jgi:hypothetical protein